MFACVIKVVCHIRLAPALSYDCIDDLCYFLGYQASVYVALATVPIWVFRFILYELLCIYWSFVIASVNLFPIATPLHYNLAQVPTNPS